MKDKREVELEGIVEDRGNDREYSFFIGKDSINNLLVQFSGMEVIITIKTKETK